MSQQQQLRWGIRTIRKSKRIVLMAWGNNKSLVVQKAIEGSIDSNLPASFLQNHKMQHLF